MRNLKSLIKLAVLSTFLLTTSVVQAGGTTDISRADLAQALINYQAEALMNQYNLDKELLFMEAPGIGWAISTGQLVSSNAATESKNALSVSNQAFIDLMMPFTNPKNTKKVTLSDGNPITLSNLPTLSPTEFYKRIQKFVNGSNPEVIDKINPGKLLQSHMIGGTSNTGQPQLTADDALGIIALITNPLPASNATLSGNISKIGQVTSTGSYELSGDDQQTVAQGIADVVNLGLSTSALGGIVARRMPITAGNTQTSMMKTMHDYSILRFASPDWYDALAGSSETAILREIAHMHAYAIWSQHQQFLLQEQQTALLASVNANLARLTNMLSGITQSVNNAASSSIGMQSQLNSLSSTVNNIQSQMGTGTTGTTGTGTTSTP